MRWFKHFTKAGRSIPLAKVRDKFGWDGVGRYWALVEIIGEEWDENEPALTIHPRTLAEHLGYYRHSSAIQWLKILDTLGVIVFQCGPNVSDVIKIEIPNMSDLIGKDDKYNAKRNKNNDSSTTLEQSKPDKMKQDYTTLEENKNNFSEAYKNGETPKTGKGNKNSSYGTILEEELGSITGIKDYLKLLDRVNRIEKVNNLPWYHLNEKTILKRHSQVIFDTHTNGFITPRSNSLMDDVVDDLIEMFHDIEYTTFMREYSSIQTKIAGKEDPKSYGFTYVVNCLNKSFNRGTRQTLN